MGKKLLLLDLFSGAGGASKGYSQAGFSVVGVDINFQPNYPYDFYQSDWKVFLEKYERQFDVFHASPPCQSYSVLKNLSKSQAPLLIPEVREALKKTGKPYVIENVKGAKKHMINPITLRGNMFGLRVIRDRLFETNPFILSSPLLPVKGTTNSHRGLSTGGEYICVAGKNFYVAEASLAMGIDWMTGRKLAQAIPSSYTDWIGRQLINFC